MRLSCGNCPDEYDCCKDCAKEWRKLTREKQKMECKTCEKWGRYKDREDGLGGCSWLGRFTNEDFFCKFYKEGETLDQVENNLM